MKPDRWSEDPDFSRSELSYFEEISFRPELSFFSFVKVFELTWVEHPSSECVKLSDGWNDAMNESSTSGLAGWVAYKMQAH